ncbi:MAG TPA: hypothetical protein DD723_08820 [Candidatus Omnitrophica bacterium]|nr:MAG: hypothetical protein A2Z81_08420 [Omnitrophica WOR_2 bacterium GWA2_45_18]OGX19374.1 MAG: hypothetical protein A2Y04_02055 [Omnitrophica WOR_2 bacterium GWC2_45_7]HBR15619.1 hypothetical protein [Candidatus Omnitrophota bacterium]
MKNSQNKNIIMSSIEDASIFRKFTVLFLLMSVIPVSILYYFYLQIKETGQVQITESNLNITLTFVVFGSIVGFFAMRSVLKKLMTITQTNREALEGMLSPSKIKELSREQNELTVLARSFSAITMKLEENIKNLESTKKTLHTVMGKVGQGISNKQNIDSFLELILETVTEALSGKVGVLMLFNGNPNELYVKAVYGADYNKQEPISLTVKEGSLLEAILKSKRAVQIPKLSSEIVELRKHAHLFEFPVILTPLVYQESVKGLFSISEREVDAAFEEDERNLLFNLATQTAVAIENSRLTENIEKTYFETISALALAVDAKDKYSLGHLDRVANYSIQIANKLGLEEEDIKNLRDGARLHDLGKIGIPDEVLCKEGTLNEQEWLMMKRHPEIGESIIKPVRSLEHLCDMIRHHHEKLDGSGYPDGLRGDEVTPLVRILAVADIYDALITDRPYRKRMSLHEACAEMRKMKGQLDQDVVELFIEALEENNVIST